MPETQIDLKKVDPIHLLREGAESFTLVVFRQLLIDMTKGQHAPGTISQGRWWLRNLESYMRDGSLPRRRDADPKLYGQL